MTHLCLAECREAQQRLGTEACAFGSGSLFWTAMINKSAWHRIPLWAPQHIQSVKTYPHMRSFLNILKCSSRKIIPAISRGFKINTYVVFFNILFDVLVLSPIKLDSSFWCTIWSLEWTFMYMDWGRLLEFFFFESIWISALHNLPWASETLTRLIVYPSSRYYHGIAIYQVLWYLSHDTILSRYCDILSIPMLYTVIYCSVSPVSTPKYVPKIKFQKTGKNVPNCKFHVNWY